MHWYKRLLGYALAHPASFGFSIAASLAGMVGPLVIPLIERAALDRLVDRHGSSVLPLLGLLLATGLGLAVINRVQFYYAVRASILVLFDLRMDVHRKVLALDRAALDEYGPGQLLERMTSDITNSSGIFYFTTFRITSVLLLVLSTAVMLWLSVWMGAVSGAVLLFLLVLTRRFQSLAYEPSVACQQREGDLLQAVDEDVAGVQVVKAFGQERAELVRVGAACDAVYDAQMDVIRLQARYQPLLALLPAVGQAAVLGVGGWLALRHRISLGTFLACTTYVAQLVDPVRSLAGMITTVQQARAGAVRVFDLLDRTPRLADRPDSVDPIIGAGTISFQGVTFGYDPTAPVVSGLEFEIAAGTSVAIVGPSGSGKSTVLDLLLRFHDPQEGRVLIDGQDIRHVRLAPLRHRFGVVFEDSFLFAGTVRQNIAYGDAGADEETIVSAAKLAQAHEFIAAFPSGYDTVVGERGVRVSGGQRQRIALARALVGDAGILVLDDATSAVDVITEERVHEALRRQGGRTIVMACSRRSSAELADVVLVLGDGHVVDRGAHSELMARSEKYRRLMSEMDEETVAAEVARLQDEPIPTVTAAAWPNAAGVSRRRDTTSVPVVDLDQPPLSGRLGLLRLVATTFRRALLIGLGLVALDALAGIAGPYLIRFGLNRGVLVHSNRTLVWATIAYLAIAIADVAVQRTSTLVIGRVSRSIMRWLRGMVWARLQSLSLDYYERVRTGHVTTHMTSDVDTIQGLFSRGLLPALVSVATAAGVAVVMLVVGPVLALCSFTVFVPLAIVVWRTRKRLHYLYGVSRDMEGEMAATFRDDLAGVRECQTYGHQELTYGEWTDLVGRYAVSRYVSARVIANKDAFVDVLSVASAVIVLGVGGHMLRSGALTAGTLIAFLLYSSMLFSPILTLANLAGMLQQTRVALERLAEVLSAPSQTPEGPDAVSTDRLTGALELQNVGFTYPHDNASEEAQGKVVAALAGVNLAIRPGETVAIVGETGAGKSTMMKLLLRLYDPDPGRVSIDGRDIRSLKLVTYRHQVGYVPQDGFIFTGTVRDNIAYGRRQASDAEVEAAARTVGAHDFIAELPLGYMEPLAGGGRSLSAGHRQLIALARAELIGPRILLLDEATAKLDLTSEMKVAVGMRRASRNRTTVLIAHRLQTARSADRIVVMDHGAIAEVGAHDELLARAGKYAALWKVSQGVTT